MSVFDPIRPYADLVKWIAGAVVVGVIFLGGRSCGVASMKDELAAKNEALTAASASLKAAGNALRAQNEAKRQAVEAEQAARRHAETAREAAEREATRLAKQAQARADEFDRRLRIAQRRPECKALLDTDVRQSCGL